MSERLVGAVLGVLRATGGWVNRVADRVVATTFARTCPIRDVPEGSEVSIRGHIEASNPVLAAPLTGRPCGKGAREPLYISDRRAL